MIFLEFIQACLFGLIQGLSEFLPISSSGHLVLLGSILNIGSLDLLFILVLHLGTLAAILSYYKSDLGKILKQFKLKKPMESGRLAYLLLWATLPGVLGAFFLVPLVKKSLLQNHWTGIGFIFTATYLFLTRRHLKRKKNDFHFNNISHWNHFSFSTAFLIGLAQVLAFFSRYESLGLDHCYCSFFRMSAKTGCLFQFPISYSRYIGRNSFSVNQ